MLIYYSETKLDYLHLLRFVADFAVFPVLVLTNLECGFVDDDDEAFGEMEVVK